MIKKERCNYSKIDLARAVYSTARCLDARDFSADMKNIKKIFSPIKVFHATPCTVFSRKNMTTRDQLGIARSMMDGMSRGSCNLSPDEDEVIGYTIMDIEYRRK